VGRSWRCWTRFKAAKAAGALERARALHRKAQWRLDFVAAENSMGPHAPQEAARPLGESIDYGRQAQLSVERLRLGSGGEARGGEGWAVVELVRLPDVLDASRLGYCATPERSLAPI
jgi:formate-dependent nitrite reductase cytochrome c552 subunit